MTRIKYAVCEFIILKRRIDKNLPSFALKFVHDHQSAYRACFFNNEISSVVSCCVVILYKSVYQRKQVSAKDLGPLQVSIC